jgi:hypothetical protein
MDKLATGTLIEGPSGIPRGLLFSDFDSGVFCLSGRVR